MIEQVSLDLQAAFPEANGFSTRNLWNMKKWYSFYASTEIQQLLPKLNQSLEGIQEKLQQVAAELPSEKLQQVVAEFPFPSSFGYVPWGHHILDAILIVQTQFSFFVNDRKLEFYGFQPLTVRLRCFINRRSKLF